MPKIAKPSHALAPYPLSPIGINWIGLWTLYLKEVRRFLNVFTQTILAPVVTTLLFLAVFTLAFRSGSQIVSGLDFRQFLAPGLIMMAMMQNAFANTSSSLMLAKVQGNIVDILLPPLSPLETTLAYAAAGTTRGLVVGLVVGLAMLPFVGFELLHPGFVLFHAVMASLLLSLLGMIGGIWSEKFDHIAAVTNFIVTPASFLSGTFYSVQRLPEFWQIIAHLNPFFYMIDGFRYGFIDHADSQPTTGLIVLSLTNLFCGWGAYRLLKIGYRLKS